MRNMKDGEEINFEEYDIKFTEKEFEKLSKEELDECKELIAKIKKILDK